MEKYLKAVKKRKRAIALGLAVAIIMFLLAYFQKNVTSIMVSISEASIRSITTVAVNDAIYYTLNDFVRYEEIVTIHRDDNGKIVGITSNSIKMNEIARDTAYISQENLTRMSAEGIQIPLGALTGAKVLAGFGPKINIKIIPIGNIRCEFVSEFTSSGLNQTRHRIFLEIISDISIIMPSATSNLASVTQVLLCESIIVGEVPSTYLQANILGDSYKLVPGVKE